MLNHVFFPPFNPEALTVHPSYREWIQGWLNYIYENIEHGDIAMSECVFGLISEIILYHSPRLDWSSVIQDLLTDATMPIAYSEQYGKRLHKFDAQWKQTPVHAVYNHYWISSQYGNGNNEQYVDLINSYIQPSGWIYNPDVSDTQVRTRMKSELLLGIYMGAQILTRFGREATVRPSLLSTISHFPPTGYIAAEYYRASVLRTLNAEHLRPADYDVLISNCMLDIGFSDFNVENKVDDYMGTKKRVQRDKMVHSPLATLYSKVLAQSYCSEEVSASAGEHIRAYTSLLTDQPLSIPAFTIRDLDVAFGAGITTVEVISAILLLNLNH